MKRDRTLQKWVIVDSEMVANNPWNGLRKDRVRLPDGSEVSDFYLSIRPHVAIVFAVTDDGDVVLVRQYKHGAGEVVVELPAGGFTEGDPAEHAARELREETGYGGGTMTAIGVLFDDVTKNTNRVHVFLSTGARLLGEQMLDDIEARSGVDVVLVPVAKVREMVMKCAIAGESSVAGALLALAFLDARRDERP